MDPKYFICVLQNFYQNKMYKCNLIFANYYLSKMIGIRLSEISINFKENIEKIVPRKRAVYEHELSRSIIDVSLQ